jgi:hypothetical protein
MFSDDSAGLIDDDVTIDDCNFNETHMHEKGLAAEKLTQLSRKRTKKTKFNIPNIQNEKMPLDEIETPIYDHNETIIDFVHNFNDEDYILYEKDITEEMTLGKPKRSSTLKLYQVASDENITTTYTSSRKLTGDDPKPEKCAIF